MNRQEAGGGAAKKLRGGNKQKRNQGGENRPGTLKRNSQRSKGRDIYRKPMVGYRQGTKRRVKTGNQGEITDREPTKETDSEVGGGETKG